MEDLHITGELNLTTPRIQANLSSVNSYIDGNLNIYTMETGDGRELELCALDGYLCWRRLHDVTWNQWVSFDELKPQRGVDYFTLEDIVSIIPTIVDNLPHNSLLGRNTEDQHPISAINNLQEELNDRVHKLDTSTPDNLVVATVSGELQPSNYKCSDFATKSELQEVIPDLTYTHTQRNASTEWNIIHNLNKMPSVNVVDSAGSSVVGEVCYINMNQLKILFTGAFSGKAYLN